jgi:IS5 family transposase
VFSLHESHVYAITKGKDHKKYEYGTKKASIVTTKKSGVIVGVCAYEKNEHNSKTLEAALTSANANRTKPINEAICDRGYRGNKEVLGTIICIPDQPKKRDSKYQREQKRKKFRRRAAICKCGFPVVMNLLLVISSWIIGFQETILKGLSVMRSIY